MASSFEPLFNAAAPDAGSAGSSNTNANAPSWIAAMGEHAGFVADQRFGMSATQPAEPERSELDQALEVAIAEAEQRGRDAATAEMTQDQAARAGLALSLSRLDDELRDQLAAQLAETVAALCEVTLAPLTIDQSALQDRCIAAAAKVGDGIIDASLHLHPDDIALLDPTFAATWHIRSNLDLERGTVEFDMPEGAVRDGPAEWRAALREALGLC